jgi:hypothetical protein
MPDRDFCLCAANRRLPAMPSGSDPVESAAGLALIDRQDFRPLAEPPASAERMMPGDRRRPHIFLLIRA